ncbi:hypothetical protein GE09DRAFT_1161621 [Coniochaeta sp. 2T2.1]|nr:hypothetical protein GE09DRAFT_1161621 [Coniochaeta sp. 2T2.1]
MLSIALVLLPALSGMYSFCVLAKLRQLLFLEYVTLSVGCCPISLQFSKFVFVDSLLDLMIEVFNVVSDKDILVPLS